MSAFLDSLLDRIPLRTIQWCAGIITAICAGVAAMGMAATYNWGSDLGGEEAAEWHLTADGVVRVHSRICLTSVPPAGISLLPIHLPYENAHIESARLEGEALSFVEKDPLPKLESDTALCLSRPRETILGKSIEVVWSFPFADLEKKDDLYRIRLESLIPVKSFNMLAVVDEGSGYIVKWNEYEGRVFQPFFMNTRPRPFFWCRKPYIQNMGTCGWPIQPVALPERPK